MNNARRLTIKKFDINNMMTFLVILMTVLISKTYYFGVANRSLYQYIYYAVVILGVAICNVNKRRLSNSIGACSIFILLIVFNIVINYRDMSSSNVNLALGNALIFLCSALTVSYIQKKTYSAFYIKIITVMSLVSIPCVIIANVAPDLAKSFCQSGYDWRTPVGYSVFYTWGWNGTIFSRNSGMFWEPGAFQAYIVLAILMLLYDVDQNQIKRRRETFVILLVTLLTTQSTTGYIVLILVLLVYWDKIRKIFGNVNIGIRNIIVLLIVGVAVYIIISSGNISNKLTGLSTDSATIRFLDITGGIRMMAKGGLFGLGETEYRDTLRTIYSVSSNDSVGLFAMTYNYGWLFSIFYVGMMAKGALRLFRGGKPVQNVTIVMILIVLHMTEGLWNLPVYVIIIFMGLSGKEKKQALMSDNVIAS